MFVDNTKYDVVEKKEEKKLEERKIVCIGIVPCQ